MVDLIYELVPGVEAAEAPTDRSQPFTVDATYGADVPLLWSTGVVPVQMAWVGLAGSRNTKGARALSAAWDRGRSLTARST